MSSQKLEKQISYEMLLCLKYGWKQHPTYKGSEQCSICLDDLQGKYVLETACNHCYDLECIMTTLTDFSFYKCPSCAKEYKPHS